ncbi:MAG: nitroreductase family protein [Chloroflexota bacterium]|nr:nitroreductase family protein [Chloroflexota bacterium]
MNTATTPTSASAIAALLDARRSIRRLGPASFSPMLIADLAAATHSVPSAFNAQPWHVVVLQDRNAIFWDRIEEAITVHLEGERRARYLARAAGMRQGGMTLLVFEDRARVAPRDGLAAEETRDQASQSIGMVQLAVWLTITAHGLSTSLQHWHVIADIERLALDFVGLAPGGYRLVSFMPVGEHAEPLPSREEVAGRFSMEHAIPER